jgi:MYXO-CTERM domain-containing protein
MIKLSAGLLTVAALSATPALAQIRITEWMYSQVNSVGEFVELTNVGNTPIDMTGWSYDDDSRLPGVLSLSAFGVVQPGQSVIITEAAAGDFRANWNLPASVLVIGGNTANLGRNDEINIFNAALGLADRLTFGDQNFPGTIRTQGRSGNLPFSLPANTVSAWTLSAVGDIYGSRLAVGGTDVANPGSFVPAPGAAALLGLGALAAGRRRR